MISRLTGKDLKHLVGQVDGHNIFEVVEAFEKCRNVKD
jgi:hypothetical protein